MSKNLDFVGDLVRDLQRRNASSSTLLQKPEHLEEIAAVMSNFDGRIDEGIATQLQTGDYFAQYSAWNFCGYVWRDRDAAQWHCEIWRYNTHADTLTAENLEAIMREAGERYGRE